MLVVEGGIAGLMSAIHAADRKAHFIVAEKANTKRSNRKWSFRREIIGDPYGYDFRYRCAVFRSLSGLIISIGNL